MIMSNDEKRSFEQALADLEDHVRKLDGGELALEDSLTTFESGVRLVRECSELLDDAEQRITELTDTGTEDKIHG
jgi:exodeoxyribonuclease VII small subunit